MFLISTSTDPILWSHVSLPTLYHVFLHSQSSNCPCSCMLLASCVCRYMRFSNNTFGVEVDSQADVDHLVQGCTSIVGDILLQSNYTGAFHLSGITNMSGIVYAGDSPQYLNLTSITFDDMLTLGGLDVPNAPALTLVSLPKVQTIGYIDVKCFGKMNVSAPSTFPSKSTAFSR